MSVAPAAHVRPAPRLRHRPATRADLPECMTLVPAWLALDDATRAGLPALWERLVEEPSVMASITEDLGSPVGSRILSFAVAMAITPTLIAELALDTAPQPHVAQHVYRALIDDRYAPMTEREIGLASASADLHLLGLHFSMVSRDFSEPLAQSLIVMGAESFRTGLSGYNLRGFYFENCQFHEPWMLITGFLRRAHAAPAPETAAPADRLQYFRVTRDEAIALVPGSSIGHIFNHHAPLFRLSPSQRRLLWLSLFDDNDDAQMQRLGVSAHGLKKLWRGIYERVQDQQPDFFGDAAGDDDGKRGREKRRHVLAYVRQRPEELRPWVVVP